MRTTLIAFALLAVALASPVLAKQSQHHARNSLNTQAQIPAAKPAAAMPPGSYIGGDGQWHDPVTNPEIHYEAIRGP